MVKEARWMDRLSLIFSLSVVMVAAGWLIARGTFAVSLPQTNNETWYILRSAGITSYILMTVSMLWGLAVSSRIVKDWSPGALSMLLHSTISWLAIIFALIHAGLLLWDEYFSYTIADLLIPFIGPYKPLAVGLGTLAFWIGLLIALSFPVKKRLGQRTWKKLHLTSYLSFGLITAHGLLAGTDAHNFGFQMLMSIGAISVISMLAYRVSKS